jgi:6-pyruvoyltetrahydropterin/6-carboxytetrahydropterin synthase
MPFLTKQYKFCAAHRYWNPNWDESKNLEIFGEDVKIHGHNYILDVTVSGEVDPDSGFIVNIKELNEVVKSKIISVLDHSQIEKDVDWFKGKQPSTENLVIFIWEQIESSLDREVVLYSIKLRETPTIYTTYYGPNKHHN